ncbi:MAG: SRPBCC family protein [Ferruginibacter sp.]|nr:SRPBCC family protein [Ferruginibacter sp.]
MKILKKLLLFVIFLIAIILIAALFISKDYLVEKSITINKPTAEVFNYIKFLKNQNEYSKWAKLDTAMVNTFTGIDATVGFKSSWEGNKEVGKGTQEIKKIDEGKRVDYELKFEKPMKDESLAYMSTDSVGVNKTLVKWGISGHMKYPFNFMGLFMNKMIGGDLEIGLANLKNLQEKN